MAFLNPETTVKSLGILPGMRVADFGCGSGHWVLVLAHAVGPGGKIFAIDIQTNVLEALQSRVQTAHLTTIETICTNLEKPHSTALKDLSLDAVLISNMLFQAHEKTNVVMEAARVVKPGGRIFLIEWDNTESPIGPPLSQRVSRSEAERIMDHVGLHFEKEFAAGSYHYGLIFRKR